MRVFTPGMEVIYGLCGTRVCLLLVFVFACSSLSVTAANKISVPLSSRHPSSLTSQQQNSSVTIVFRDIDIKNRTAVDFARREVRRKILEYLKHKKSTVASTTWTTTAPSTSVVSTTATAASTPEIIIAPSTPATIAAALTVAPTTRVSEDTTQTSTNVTTSVVTTLFPVTTKTTACNPCVSPNRKRRRRESEESNCPIMEDDLIFVENDDETDEHGNLRISLYSDNQASECKDIIFKVLTELNKPDEDDGLKTIAPVVEILRGLPPAKVELVKAGYQVWLPILLAIFLLLIIFIFVCCWRATHNKGKANDRQKIIPTQDSKLSPSNGHAPPRILDDNYGWLIPYEQFSSEQK